MAEIHHTPLGGFAQSRRARRVHRRSLASSRKHFPEHDAEAIRRPGRQPNRHHRETTLRPDRAGRMRDRARPARAGRHALSAQGQHRQPNVQMYARARTPCRVFGAGLIENVTRNILASDVRYRRQNGRKLRHLFTAAADPKPTFAGGGSVRSVRRFVTCPQFEYNIS